MLYIETSARSQENIERAFVWPTSNILDKIDGGFIKVDEKNPGIKLHKDKKPKTSIVDQKC